MKLERAGNKKKRGKKSWLDSFSQFALSASRECVSLSPLSSPAPGFFFFFCARHPRKVSHNCRSRWRERKENGPFPRAARVGGCRSAAAAAAARRRSGRRSAARRRGRQRRIDPQEGRPTVRSVPGQRGQCKDAHLLEVRGLARADEGPEEFSKSAGTTEEKKNELERSTLKKKKPSFCSSRFPLANARPNTKQVEVRRLQVWRQMQLCARARRAADPPSARDRRRRRGSRRRRTSDRGDGTFAGASFFSFSHRPLAFFFATAILALALRFDARRFASSVRF